MLAVLQASSSPSPVSSLTAASSSWPALTLLFFGVLRFLVGLSPSSSSSASSTVAFLPRFFGVALVLDGVDGASQLSEVSLIALTLNN